MRSDVFVYIAGPITAKSGFTVEESVASAVKEYFELIRLGIPAFCPHLNAAFPSAFEIPWERWLEYDHFIIKRCTHLLLLPRWRESKGAMEERVYADALNLRVCESIPELLVAINEE
jgi:hypothetical protein